MLNSTQKKRIEAERNDERDRKVFNKLMSNAAYGKNEKHLQFLWHCLPHSSLMLC